MLRSERRVSQRKTTTVVQGVVNNGIGRRQIEDQRTGERQRSRRVISGEEEEEEEEARARNGKARVCNKVTTGREMDDNVLATIGKRAI